jgi:hypothetical protein
MKPPADVREQLARALLQWLDIERRTLAKSWEAKGLSPLVQVNRVLAYCRYERLAERKAEWSLEFESNKIDVSRCRLAHGMSMRWSGSPPPVTLVVEAYGKACVGDSDPQLEHLNSFLGNMCGDYLSRLPDITSAAPGVAESVVEEYLQCLESDELIEVTQVPVGGITPPESPMVVDSLGVGLRALTPDELGELNRDVFGLNNMFESTVLPATMRLFRADQIGLESCMLSTSEPKARLGKTNGFVACSSHHPCVAAP